MGTADVADTAPGVGVSSRDRILDAAARVIAHRGLANTSLQDIVAEAGLTTGAVYSNFRGKDDVLKALLTRTWEDSTKLDDVSSSRAWVRWLFSMAEDVGLGREEQARLGLALLNHFVGDADVQATLAEQQRTAVDFAADRLTVALSSEGRRWSTDPHEAAVLVVAATWGFNVLQLIAPTLADDEHLLNVLVGRLSEPMG